MHKSNPKMKILRVITVKKIVKHEQKASNRGMGPMPEA
jgi:hypothetical protein